MFLSKIPLYLTKLFLILEMNYNKMNRPYLNDILKNFFHFHDIKTEDITRLLSELSDAKDAQYYPRATNQTDEWYQIEELLGTLLKIRDAQDEEI